MHKILNLGNMTARYWVEELPELSTEIIQKKHEVMKCSKYIGLKQTSKLAVELYLHKNVSNYGLLGFEFNPHENLNHLEIEIKYSNVNTKYYESKINQYDETIYCGLPKEYVPYINKNLRDNIQKCQTFYHGSLIVSCATNSEVGSSPKMYCMISDILFELFIGMQKNELFDLDAYFKSKKNVIYGIKNLLN